MHRRETPTLKDRLKSAVALFSAVSLFVTQSTSYALALPTGGQVNGGSATINTGSTQVDVNQSSHSALIDWNSFNVSNGEAVNFNQPNSSAIALNKIHDANPSQIDGALNANGQVWLVNSQGIAFGANAQVNVGGLLATSSDIDDSRFMNGDYTFDHAGNPNATISNAGTITAADHGMVAMVAPNVTNSGTIKAKLGKVRMASGDGFSLDLNGDGLINLQASDAITNQLVQNSGSIQANGGSVVMTKAAARNAMNSLINMDGAIQADNVDDSSGSVALLGGGTGTTLVAGTISVQGLAPLQKGGTVDVLDKNVGIASTATIDASGKAGGGTIRVGGDYHGGGGVATAKRTIVQSGAKLKANAIDKGDGGKVVVWSDERTDFAGNIEAKGGINGGNGGFVETSGKQFLAATGTVDASAPFGNPGLWLLDPNNITIQSSGTDINIAGSPNFTSTDDSAIVTTGSIQTALNAGTSVTVTTGSGGANTQAGNITVASTIQKTAGGDATLTLDAANDIVVNSSTNIFSSSGKLNTILTSDFDNSGAGAIVLNNGSGIITNGGNISLGGAGAGGYAMGNATNTKGISIGSASLTASGGNITIRGQGYGSGTNNNYGVYLNGATVTTTGTGTISLAGIGGGSGTGSGNYGVYISGNTVMSAVNGTMAITGTGGGGNAGNNDGVAIDGPSTSVAATGNGQLNITGTGGAAGGNNNAGVYVGGGTVSVTNGNMTINATGGASNSDYNYGFNTDSGTIQTTSIGTISITGQGGASTGNSNYNVGIMLNGGDVTSTGGPATPGNITFNGTGGNSGGIGSNNIGVYVSASDVTSNSGAISATGTGGSSVGAGNFDSGIYFDNAGTMTATGNGAITLTGFGNGGGTSLNNQGVEVFTNSTVSTVNGNITISGTGGTGSGSQTTDGISGGIHWGVEVAAGGKVQSTGSGNIAVTGTGGTGAGGNNIGVVMIDEGSGSPGQILTASGTTTITGIGGSGGANNTGFRSDNTANTKIGNGSTTGAVTLEADSITVGTNTTFNSTSSVTIRPHSVGTTVGFAGGAGSLAVSQAIMNNINAPTVTIGRSDSTATLTTGAYTWNSGITSLSLLGNNITVGGAITKSAGANSSLLLQGNGNITVSGAITSSSNKLNVTIDSDYDANSSGYIKIASLITSNNGDIVLGGGATPLSGYAYGNAGQASGILISNASSDATISAGTGSITAHGHGYNNAAGSNNYGIWLDGSTDLVQSAAFNTTSGNITAAGIGGNGIANNYGLYINGASHGQAMITTATGAMTLTGTGGTAGNTASYTGNSGIVTTGNNGGTTIASTGASGAGDVTITGTGADGYSDNYGISSGGQTFTNGANMTITGTGGKGAAGNNIGIYYYSDDYNGISSSGTGNLTVDGYGGNGTSSNYGLYVYDRSGISMNGTGTLFVRGTGGTGGTTAGYNNNMGIMLAGHNSGYFGTIRSTCAAGCGTSSVIGIGANGYTGNFGIDLGSTGTSISTVGSTMYLTAVGGNGAGGSNGGLFVSSGSSISSSGAGSMTIAGTGGNGGNSNNGVEISGGSITATGAGTIGITGNGGTGPSVHSNNGVYMYGSTATISSTSSNVTVNGNGGGSGIGSGNTGITMSNSSLITTGGGATLSVVGIGGNGSGNGGANYGIAMSGDPGTATISNTGSGSLTVAGIGSNSAAGNNIGLYAWGRAYIQGNGGTMTVAGVGGTSAGDSNYGIQLGNSGYITNTGNGALTVSGFGGGSGTSGNDFGVDVGYINGEISTVNGTLTVNGVGAGSTGSNNYGVLIGASGANPTIKTTGTGNLIINGVQGGGANNTGVVLATAGTPGFQTTGGGNITVNTDTISMTGAGDITSSGNLTIAPYTASTTVGLGGSAGTLNLSAAYLGYLSTAGTTTIGRADGSGLMRVAGADVSADTFGHLALLNGSANIQFDGGATLKLASNKNFSATTTSGDITSSADGGIQTQGTGTLTLNSGHDINFANDFDLTSSTGAISLYANNHIMYSGNGDIASSGGNILLNSDRDASGMGAINLQAGSDITSGGGNITLGGGSGAITAGSGYAVGDASSTVNDINSGVWAIGSLDAGGGNIIINGRGGNDNNHLNYGVVVGNAQTSGTGAITVYGQGGNGSGNSNAGILTGGSGMLQTVNGDITLVGTGGTGTGSSTGNYGVGNGGIIRATGTGNIIMTGTGGNSPGTLDNGVVATIYNGNLVQTNSGNITITGTDGGHADGIEVLTQSASGQSAGIKSATGTITLNGSGTNNGVYLLNGGYITSTGSSNIIVNGITGTNGIRLDNGTSYFGGSSAAGNITLNTDTINWGAGTILTTGNVFLKPYSQNGTTGVAGAVGNLGITTTLLGSISANTLTIGRSDGTGLLRTGGADLSARFYNLAFINGSGGIEFDGGNGPPAQNLTLAANKNFSATTLSGGDIYTNGDGSINTSGTGTLTLTSDHDIQNSNNFNLNSGAGAVTLSAKNDIIYTGGGDITTSGSSVTLRSDSDGSGAGAIELADGSSIATSGGDITLGGGSGAITGGTLNADGTINTAATGFAWGDTGHSYGVDIHSGFGGGLSSGAGNIIVNGSTNRNNGYGVYVYQNGGTTVLQSTTGNITVNGVSNGAGSSSGTYWGNGAGMSTASGALTLNASSTTGSQPGLTGSGASFTSSGAGSVGAITFNGSNTSGSNGNNTAGILATGFTVTGVGANIIMNGTSNATTGVSQVGGIVLTNDLIRTTGTGNITINGTDTANTGTANYGVQIAGASTISANGSGNVSITGDGGGTAADIAEIVTSVTTYGNAASTGNITFNADSLGITGAVQSITTTGNVYFTPRTAGTTVGVIGGNGTLSITSGMLTSISANTTTIGRADGSGLMRVTGADLSAMNSHLALLDGTADIQFDGGGTTLLMKSGKNFSATTTASIRAGTASGGIQTQGAGTIGFFAGNDINITQDFDLTSATGAITESAGKDIVYSGSGDLTTSGGNITLGADADANRVGGISLNSGTNIASAGGNITLAGGAGATGYAVGDATLSNGIYLNGNTISAVGGNIVMRGEANSTDGTFGTAGINMASTINTTNGGTISFYGRSTTTGAAGIAGNQHGIYDTSTITGVAGDINFYGNQGNNGNAGGTGIMIGSAVSSASGNINLDGRNAGIGVRLNFAGATTGSGNINVGGSGSTADILFSHGYLTSTSGNIALTGSFTDITTSSTANTIQTGGTGTVSITSNRDINFAHDLSITTGTGAVTESAKNNIVSTGGGDITTSGGNITLGSDSDASGSGAIDLEANTALASNGGNITLGGGATPATGFAYGNAAYGSGIRLFVVNMTSGGGNIVMHGESYQDPGLTYGNNGINISSSTIAATGNGSITMYGQRASTGSVGTVDGILLNNPTISVVNGNLALYGNYGTTGQGSYMGIQAGGGTISSSGTGTITLWGENGGYGFYTTIGTITSANGDINITGSGTGRDVDVQYSTISSTGTGPTAAKINITGTNTTMGGWQPGAINTVDGNVTITANNDFNMSNDFDITATGTANVTIKAKNSILYSGQGDITTSGGNITLDADSDASGAGAIYLGALTMLNSNNGNITLGGGATPSTGYAVGTAANKNGVALDDAAINVGTGNFLALGRSYAAGFITYNGISLANTSTVTATGAGTITLNGITSDISPEYHNGIGVFDSTLSVANGAMALTGTYGNSNSESQTGIYANNSTFQSTGSGTITMTGTAAPTHSYGTGIQLDNTTVTSVNGNIALTGNAGTGFSYGLGIFNGSISSTGTGASALNITLTGNSSGGNAGSYGLLVNGALAAVDGSIALNGTNGLAPIILGSTITATGAGNVNVNNAATLDANASIAANTGNIVFGSTVDSYDTTARNLSVSSTGGSITLGGALGGTNALGAASLTSSGSLVLPAITASSVFARTTGATSDMTLNNAITASGTGNAIVLSTNRFMINNAGASPLILTGGGRFIGYSNKKVDDTNPIFATQQITGYNYATLAPGSIVPTLYNGTQNTWVYNTATGTITIVAANKSMTYGGANPAFTYSFACSDGCLSSVMSGSLATDATTSGAGAYNAGAWNILQGTLATSNGYTINFTPGTFTVNPAALLVAADVGQTKIYGSANPGAYTYGASGFVNGDTSAILTGALARVAGENVGNYAINQGTLAANSNYTISYTSHNFAITPATLNVTADAGQSKIYGAANPTYTYGYSGLVNGDTAAVFNGTQGRAAGENVGNYAINQGTLTAGANYTINYTSNNFAINPATLTVTANAGQSKTYGVANPTYTYGYSGLVNGDTATVFTGAQTRAAGENVGNYAISQGTLSAGSNYTIAYTGNTFAINPATLTVTATAGQNKTYGAVDPAGFTYGYSGLTNGDTSSVFTGAQTRAAGENVGAYAISQGTLSAGSNYTIAYTGNNFTINKATLTVNADIGQTKVYGSANPTPYTYNYSGLVNGDTSAVFTGAQARAAGENVGNYAINQGTLSAGGNYNITYTGHNFAITPATLTVTATAGQSKTYGAANPTYTYGYSGLVNGDTSSVFTGSQTRAAGENVGSYAISQGTLAAGGNYNISYTGNSFTINPATLTVTANALSKSYGQADPTLTYSLSGLKNGDNATIMTGSQVRVAGENVGTYAITQGTLAATSNYTIAYTGANFTINQAQLAVSADPKHKEIGDPDPALTYTFGTLYNGDTAASVFSGALTRVAGETQGGYAINQGTLVASANYHIVYTPGLFTVGNYVPPAITSGIPSVVNGYIHESNSVLSALRRMDLNKLGADGMIMDSMGMQVPPENKPMRKALPEDFDTSTLGEPAVQPPVVPSLMDMSMKKQLEQDEDPLASAPAGEFETSNGDKPKPPEVPNRRRAKSLLDSKVGDSLPPVSELENKYLNPGN